MLIALPTELRVQVLACLAAAVDFARAVTSCTACHNALELALRVHVLGRGLPSSEARPWLQLLPFKRIRVPWTFLLRVAEVRPRVLEAMGANQTRDFLIWLGGKHDKPTAWCIANEQQRSSQTSGGLMLRLREGPGGQTCDSLALRLYT